METMELRGVPWLGEKTAKVYAKLREFNKVEPKVVKEVYYSSMENLIEKEVLQPDGLFKLVLIKNERGWFISYLRDLRFNYRDKRLYIPYFSFDTYDLDYNSNSDFELCKRDVGHILFDDKQVHIRYNYQLEEKEFNLEAGKETSEVFLILGGENFDEVAALNLLEGWAWARERKTFNLENLYSLYLDSAYRLKGKLRFADTKHIEGYHFILNGAVEIYNKEAEIRNLLYLDNFKTFKPYKDYRDVREYNENSMDRLGIVPSYESYNIRRLRFEMRLFSILRDNLEPDDEAFKEKWSLLRQGKPYIKYGREAKLIFKNYWLNESSYENTKSWCRI